MREAARRAFCMAVSILSLISGSGCGGGGSSGSSGDPPASVAGTWESVMNNAGSAILACSGDAAALSGLSVAGWLAAAPDCTPFSVVVGQTGNNFTFAPRDVACNDGSLLTWSGGGTVTGNNLAGQFDTIFTIQGITRVESFTGAVNGNTINLLEDRIVWSGNFVGACDIAPALSLQVTIYP
jgi:hypothetical protein